VEFILLTFWTSWDAITAFAGDDVSKAVLYPEDHAYFTRCDEQVQHLAVASWTVSKLHPDRSGSV
jgi:hypothetical protein